MSNVKITAIGRTMSAPPLSQLTGQPGLAQIELFLTASNPDTPTSPGELTYLPDPAATGTNIQINVQEYSAEIMQGYIRGSATFNIGNPQTVSEAAALLVVASTQDASYLLGNLPVDLSNTNLNGIGSMSLGFELFVADYIEGT